MPDDTTATPTGNAAAFCSFEASIEDATGTDSDAQFLAALRTFEPQMTQWEADAPNVQLHAAAVKLHEATQQAIATNSPAPFSGSSLDDAFLPIATFCSTDGAPVPT